MDGTSDSDIPASGGTPQYVGYIERISIGNTEYYSVFFFHSVVLVTVY
jgi:hypothetical protein